MFLSPYHPKSNGIFQNFLKAFAHKHLHGKLSWEDTLQFFSV